MVTTTGRVNIAKTSYRRMLEAIGEKHGLTPPATDALGSPVIARVNIGRWIVDCEACATTVVIDDADLFFWCCRCGSGHVWHPIEMPQDRGEIERLLMLRPGWRGTGEHRNWEGESVEELRQENRDHGVPV